MLSVVIGRFQTPYLHEGHQELFRQAMSHSDSLLVLIGCTSAAGTDKNPMNFETRKQMIKMNCEIRSLNDSPSDKDWSDQIDKIIADLGFEEATIFGGRDNSIEGRYFGKHQIKIIEERGGKSATALRKEVAKQPNDSTDFRAGIIYAAENRYPIVYSTVDVILEDGKGNVLVGKKGDKFAFIGGFVDAKDENLEFAALRELEEETGFRFLSLNYQFSMKVDDLRYKETKDSIMTHVFAGIKTTLPDLSKISDNEFTEFRFINENDLDLLQDCHKQLFLKFINSNSRTNY